MRSRSRTTPRSSTHGTSTQIANIIARTANLWGNLNARISFDVRHDTDPLPGFESTDTSTKFSLVCKIP